MRVTFILACCFFTKSKQSKAFADPRKKAIKTKTSDRQKYDKITKLTYGNKRQIGKVASKWDRGRDRKREDDIEGWTEKANQLCRVH